MVLAAADGRRGALVGTIARLADTAGEGTIGAVGEADSGVREERGEPGREHRAQQALIGVLGPGARRPGRGE